ncbi:MAG: hypothetical protein MI922_10380, partial [Bacteroidales bacterium]|nr:hypothetical protein [Bacteroidales bacterium]
MRYIAFFFSVILLSCGQPTPQHTPNFTTQSTGKWWLDKPIRLIQTNLPETNVEMDIDAYVRSLVESSANAVLVNVGGIVGNYPSELPYHYVNKRMKIDFIKAVTEKCNEHNIRVIGRFDFSKINEELAFKKKEWLYKGIKGNFVNYNGQVHACINGGYQQEYSFKILEEAITKYKLDGIFFNMIGYQTRDYSGNYHGICQCNACKKRFHDSTDLTLPTVEDMNDKTFRLYKDFKSATASDLFYRINDHIKTLDSNLAICTYTTAGVDMRRRESGTHISHEIEWNYSASDHIKIDQSMWNNKVTSNGAVHFMSIPYRHIATSPNTTRIRLAENILNGGNLDFYCIGTLINQEDRTGLDVVKDVYGFHKENEDYFTQVQPHSKVCVIKDSRDEFRGIFKMLIEEHILFDVLFPPALTMKDSPKQLSDYEVVILSNTRNLSPEQCLAIDNYVKNGGKVLATGF